MRVKLLGEFPGYEFRDDGTVWSYRRPGGAPNEGRVSVVSEARQISGKADKDGYLKVGIRNADGKRVTRTIHRLILEAFIGPCPAGMECRHLDGSRDNNSLDNLEWSTHSENIRDRRRHGTSPSGERSYCAKITNNQAATIRQMYSTGMYSQPQLAKEFRVTQASIWNIVNNRTFKETV